jgi:hypothetical protein
MLQRFMLALSILALLAAFGCQGNQTETDTPAGNQDELTDTTRLDPAPSPVDTLDTMIVDTTLDTINVPDTGGTQ